MAFLDGYKSRSSMADNWALIREKNIAKPPNKKAPEGASCGTCNRFKKLRCGLKKKVVKPYNICGEWTMKPSEFVNLCVNDEIAHTIEITQFESKEIK